MTPTATPLNGNAVQSGPVTVEGILLNPRLHGKSRVPGQPVPTFDLNAFSQALERGDVD